MLFSVGDKIRRNVLVSTDHGLMIVNRFDYNDQNVGQGKFLLDHGNASTVEAQLTYQSLFKKTDAPVIFDIGANIGTYTTWISRAFPQGTVYSFEPQRLVFQMLCGNMAINNIDNVHVHNMALGKDNTDLLITEPDYTSSADFGRFSIIRHNEMQSTNKQTKVNCMTLDSFVDFHELKTIDFMKIDAEGMDTDVLLGARETILKYRPSILVEHTDGIMYNIYDEIVDIMQEYDFYNMTIEGNNLLFICD